MINSKKTFKRIKATFQDLITGKKLTFLVGAGCSVDKPSCLVAGRTMMDAIIDHTCAEEEIAKIKNIKKLRFEQLIEILRDFLDPELKIIDYYGQCRNPNKQHIFLAKMLKEGHFVMTTNFDFLIEYAAQKSDISKNNIIPVITREDFEHYKDPSSVYNSGKVAIYKIHGSTKNIITGEDTRDSLIATIQAFGSGKENQSIFQVEPYKRPLFENISRGRILIVIGYSGNDDFDIVPTLRILKKLETLIWIYHTSKESDKEKIYKIEELSVKNKQISNKIYRILCDIYRMGNIQHIYLVKTNTSRLVKKISKEINNVIEDLSNISPKKWINDNLTLPNKFQKYLIPETIYYNFGQYDDALRCSETIINLTKNEKDLNQRSIALSNIGNIYRLRGDYEKALKFFNNALKICNKIEDRRGMAKDLSGIGLTYKEKGDYKNALDHYKQALKIDKQIGNLLGKANHLNNIGCVLQIRGEYEKALNKYKKAMQISKRLGDLSKYSAFINNMADIYREQEEYDRALNYYQEALNVAQNLGDLSKLAVYINNIGMIYDAQGKYEKAIKQFKKALNLSEKLGDLSLKAVCLNNIGCIYYIWKKYDDALEISEDVLKIEEQLENLAGIASQFHNIGTIYYIKGEYENALKKYKEALKIDEILERKPKKALRHHWIGITYSEMGKFESAKTSFNSALTLYKDLGLEFNVKKVQKDLMHLNEYFKKISE